LNTLVNFQSAQPSKTGQFSFDINTLAQVEGWILGVPGLIRASDEASGSDSPAACKDSVFTLH